MARRLPTGLLLAGIALAAAGGVRGGAQTPPSAILSASTPETSLGEVFGRLAARSAFIFAGTVDSIERKNGLVEIGLQVGQVLQGNPGAHFTLREWAGLWPPGQRRYLVGQRALFFLRAPGAAGLSSPVDGQDGVVPLAGEPSSGAARVDVRQLNTRLLRQVGQPLSPTTAISLGDATEMVVAAQTGRRRPPNPTGEQPVAIVVQATGAQPRVEGSRAQR